MNKYNAIFLLPLLLINPIKADIDKESAGIGILAGVAVTIVGRAIYDQYTNRTIEKQMIDDLKSQLDSYRTYYKDELNTNDMTNTDQKIRAISSLLLRKNYSSTQAIHNIEDSLRTLQKSLRLSQEITNEKMRAGLLLEFQKLIDNLKLYHLRFEEEKPFIDLEIARRTKDTRLHEYQTMLKSNKEYPQLSTAEKMASDEKNILHFVTLAERHCKQEKCTEFQEQLIKKGRQLSDKTAEKRNSISQTPEFGLERERFERNNIEEETIKAKNAELANQQNLQRLQEQKHRITITEQNIKQEQLRQNDEQLRQNDEMLKQKKHFEPTIIKLENDLKQCSADKKNLEQQNTAKDTNISQLQKQVNVDKEAFDHIKKDSKDLEHEIEHPSLNPESEEWIQALKEYAQRIAKNCPSNTK